SGSRVRPAVQPLPAHEADLAAQDSARARADGVRGDGPARDRDARAPRGRAHARSRSRSGPRVSDAGPERLEAGVVVIGTGVAGLTAALGAERLGVHLLTKTALESGSSPWAQGGVAVAIGRGDTPELHAAD